jgi:hypothetical protein
MDFKVKTILGFICVVAISGCHSKEDPKYVPGPVQQTVEPQVYKSSCDTMLEAIEKDDHFKTADSKIVHVERHFQRTIRKDCFGNITSDKNETVQSPRFQLELSPLSERPFKSVLVYNQPTCDHKLTSMPLSDTLILGNLFDVTGNGKDKIQIKGDLSEAFFTFKFSENENRLYVRYFYDCSPNTFQGNTHSIVGDKDCSTSKDYQTILYPISISYSEVIIDGEKTVSPTEKECEIKK